jgi:hypothetical protein
MRIRHDEARTTPDNPGAAATFSAADFDDRLS